MDNQTFQKIKDLINQHQNAGVLVGPNPTLDEMAAGLGMYLVLKKMGKDASIVSPTDPVVGISSLVGIDKVQKSFSGGGTGDLTVAFPYKEGEIEKVSYTLDGGKLNIQVKAGPQGLNFQQSDVQFVRAAAGAPSLVFMIGIPNPQTVASVFDINTNPTTSVVNIDNKDENLKYGTALNVSSRFTSVSEEVADFVTLLEPQVELDVDTCQNLLTGILFATKDFTSPNISYLAFEMAGILMKKGAKRMMPTTSQPNAVQNPGAYFPPASNAASAQQTVQPPAPVSQPMPQAYQPLTEAPAPMPMAPVAPMPQTQEFSMPNQPMMQQAPVQPFQQFEPVSNAASAAPMMQPQQPAQQFSPVQNQPFNNVQVKQPQPQAGGPLAQVDNQAPADWLTPKVYKGSTVL